MQYVSVLVAAVAAYAFGAAWYMLNAQSWMKAAGVARTEDGKPAGGNNPVPFIISAVMVIVVAGMMRHIFISSSIETVTEGLVAGGGLGLFIVTPWIVTNYAYAMRPFMLSLIDCGYAVIGCAIIGAVLTLF